MTRDGGSGVRILDAIVSVTLAVAIAIGGWALQSTIELRERVAVIESNRFTAADGHDMEEQLRLEFVQGINDIKRCLNQIQRGEDCDF